MEEKSQGIGSARRSLMRGGLFVVFFAAAFLLANMLFTGLILEKTSLRERDAKFLQSKQDINILLMGDSSTTVDLNPLLINRSFNYGVPGETYAQTYFKLRYLIETGNLSPAIIVLPFNLHSFSSYRAARIQDKWYWNRYLDYADLSKYFEDIRPFQEHLRAAFPLIGGGEILFASFFEDEGAIMVKGHIPMTDRFAKAKDKQKLANQRAAYHFRSATLLHQGLIHYFEESLLLAQGKNSTVVLIKFPVTDAYLDASREWIPDAKAFYGPLMDIVASYPNVYILDYQDAYANNHSLFADSVHLNEIGAEIFSAQVAEDLAAIQSQSLLNSAQISLPAMEGFNQEGRRASEEGELH